MASDGTVACRIDVGAADQAAEPGEVETDVGRRPSRPERVGEVLGDRDRVQASRAETAG